MKLFNQKTKKKIVCPKCGEEDFSDIEIPEVLTSTVQIWCKKADCKTDLLIPTKDLKTKMITEVT